MGIPNQVQKELALHRNSTFQPLVQPPDQDKHISGSQSGVVIIPTVDGGTPLAKKEGARVHLSELEQVLRDDHLVKKHLQTVYQDDQSFNQRGFGSYLPPGSNLRPKSLAVPGMTTSSSLSPSMINFLQEPQGPVMSISPQATYLSTIIPNAVLPASIEVIEIDRSSSRTRGSSINHGSSVRTVSKSSLTSGDLSVSPSLSRRSEGDSSHNDSMQTPTSASGSNWSESSKTIMSNSSPASSKSSTRSANSQPVGITVQEEQTAGDKDHVSLCSSVSVVSSPSGKSENIVTGPFLVSSESLSVDVGDLAKNKRNCTRSLSVMKTKQPPPPPRRTNSLHNNKIRSKMKDNSRIQADSKYNSNSTSGDVASASENIATEVDIKSMSTNMSQILVPASNSRGSLESSSSPMSPTSSIEAGRATEQPPASITSSPQKTPSEEEKFERTMSPSSGYSSQSGTPTHSPKEISPTSPDKQKKTPVKPERFVSRASSSAASPSSSLTSLSSGTSEVISPDVSACSPNLPPQGSPSTNDSKEPTSENSPSSFRMEMSELLNIPPPPKVKAPCPPPPEAWAYNRRTFEIMCGPRPSVNRVTEKPALTQDSTDKQTVTQTETRKDLQFVDESQPTPGKSDIEPSECVHIEPLGRKSPEAEQVTPSIQDKEEPSVEVQSQVETSSSEVKEPECQEKTPKKEPPPVMKKPMMVLQREEKVTEQSSQTKPNGMNGSATPEILLTIETDATSSQNSETAVVDEGKNETEKSEVPSLQTLAVEVPKLPKVSPPPTPPPTYHPTPPPSRKTPSLVSMPPNDLQRVQEESHIAESCWPPPPPPLEGDSVFDGAEEVDFPPPPPPFIADSLPDVVVDSTIVELDTSDVHHLENPDFAPTKSEPAIPDIEPLVVMPVSNTNPDGEALSCKLEQNISSVSESVTPSPLESPPIPNITRPESPVSVKAAVPPPSLLKQNSLRLEDHSLPLIPVTAQPPAPTTVPVAPPLPAETLTHGVSFRRQPSVPYRDARSKELLSRHKSVPIPKEDANIPLVTPSLLQMVRLRSVNMTEEQVKPPSDTTKSTNEAAPVDESCLASIQGPQNIPQKPIRKSLSLKSPPQHVKTSSVTMSTPSMRMQEAIRMKTAAMSSRDGLPSRMGVRSPTYGCMGDPGSLCLKSPEVFDAHKSPASTASFIFSRSTKKVVVETSAASSPEAQAILKQSLASELLQVSDQSKNASFSNGRIKCDKVPPPVAKKPAAGSISPSHNPPSCPTKMELNVEGNGAVGGVHQMSGTTLPETTTRVTADTIETLF